MYRATQLLTTLLPTGMPAQSMTVAVRDAVGWLGFNEVADATLLLALSGWVAVTLGASSYS